MHFSSYTVLDLSNNNISTIGPSAFSNVTMTTLILSHNALQTVAVEAFQGVESVLETLELEDCGLTEVPAAVSTLHRLRSLNLRHNPLITFLPGGVMASVGVTLETLDFSNTGRTVFLSPFVSRFKVLGIIVQMKFSRFSLFLFLS